MFNSGRAHHPGPPSCLRKDAAVNYLHDLDDFDPDNPLGKPDVPEDVQEAIGTIKSLSP